MLYNLPESESKNEDGKGVSISSSLSIVMLPICIIGAFISFIASKIIPVDAIDVITFIFVLLAFLSLLLLICSFIKSRFRYFINLNIIILSFGMSLFFWATDKLFTSMDLSTALYVSISCGFISLFVFICRKFLGFLGK